MTIWLFGYGSLIWRPNFKYDRKVDGYIKDWARVFYQGTSVTLSTELNFLWRLFVCIKD